jgi:deazaflavin-dependent oxidoreductase (nitroreductase family)
MSDRSMEGDLAAWAKVIKLETIGRRSGLTRAVTIGFVEEHGNALLVAAASGAADWAVNLRANPACTADLGGQRRHFVAVELTAGDRAAAISGLILKYGTPAERLGAGPAFRLEPRPWPEPPSGG